MRFRLRYFDTPSVVHGSVASASRGSNVSDLSLDSLNQSLHFNKILRWSACTIKREKHWVNLESWINSTWTPFCRRLTSFLFAHCQFSTVPFSDLSLTFLIHYLPLFYPFSSVKYFYLCLTSLEKALFWGPSGLQAFPVIWLCSLSLLVSSPVSECC